MRKLTTSLSLLTLLAPASAFAQEAVTLDESPAAPAGEPAAPAPVALEETPAPASQTQPATTTDAQASASVSGAGYETANVAAAPAPEPMTRRPASTRGGGPGGGDKWEFSYSGYFRAPMRIGISDNTGPEHSAEAGDLAGVAPLAANPDGLPLEHDADGNWTGNFKKKRVSMHRPIIPDDQYASWNFTGHNKSDWAEMFFGVGNGTVTGYLALQGFRFTDAAWKEDNAQFGISQGWVEIDSDLGFQNVKFNAKIGSHWNRYGTAGVYDSGEYDTYLIGRTHVMGGTARMDLLLPSFDVGFEGGFGVKTPDPKMFNRARFTNLAHGHAFFKLPAVQLGAHVMYAWANDSASPSYPNVQPGSSGCYWNTTPGAQCTIADDGTSAPDGTERAGGIDAANGPAGTNGRLSVFGPEYPTGTQTVLGLDAKFDLGLMGYLFAGYSYQMLKNALTVDGAIESIHSLGAGNYNLGIVDNYLESPFCYANAPNESCSNGTGGVGTALLQYELGLANFGFLPGNMDIKTKLYGMLNHVSVDDLEVQRLADLYPAIAQSSPDTINQMRQNGTLKTKFGADLEFFALEWMSAGLRFDRLNPTNNKLLKGTQGFAILSPRISFRTKMVTHETITLQYSRYFYDQRQCQDSKGNVASPADDPYRAGNQSIYGTVSADTNTGLPLRHYCVQPAPSAPPPNGFGMHSNNQTPGMRGASSLVPDENVIKLEASMWW